MNGHEEYYNRFYRELAAIDDRHNSLDKIREALPEIPPGGRVLDIGCGHGSVSAELVRRDLRVHGMEVNREALVSLEQRGIVAIAHDITRPFPRMEPFDLVLLLDVLEHVFDPVALIQDAAKTVAAGGTMIVSVPLYFDLLDRVRILFTGRVVSYDNRCYGTELYRRFRSYNYDHIRFFTPGDVLELCAMTGLVVDAVYYRPMSAAGFGRVFRRLVRLVSNRATAKLWPSLLSHSMVVRLHG